MQCTESLYKKRVRIAMYRKSRGESVQITELTTCYNYHKK